MKEIECSSGTLTVITDKRQRQRMSHHHHGTSDDFVNIGSEFMGKIRFMSKTSQIMLTVSGSKNSTILGSPLGIPTLCINNIIPSDSIVFQIAANGRVEDLLSLFASGKASLRDHDINGWSILHVSTVNLSFTWTLLSRVEYSVQNPPMCRFLVRSGLDIDEISTCRYG